MGFSPLSLCSTQKLYRCSGAFMYDSLSRNSLVAKYTSTQSSLLFAKQPQSRQKCLTPLKAVATSNTPANSASPLIGNDKIGVLLLNLGGPETLDDVQPFLFNLFADPVNCFSLPNFLICLKMIQRDKK